MMYCSGFWGNFYPRIYTSCLLDFLTGGEYLYDRYFHDVVLGHIHTGGLEVKEDYRFLEIKFHQCYERV